MNKINTFSDILLENNYIKKKDEIFLVEAKKKIISHKITSYTLIRVIYKRPS